MTYLFDPPQMFSLPLSKGRDIYFDFIYKPLVVDGAGDPVLVGGQKQYLPADYPGGASVSLVIDTPTPTTATATITGHHAVVNIDFAVADAIDSGVPYRIKMINGSVDIVLAQGKTKRVDP